MRIITGILCLALLSACHGKVVSIQSSSHQHVESKESCSYYGYCRKCKNKTVRDSRTGKNTTKRVCSNTWNSNCPGKRKVLLDKWVETRQYEDGHIGKYPQSKKIKILGECRK